MAIRVDPEGFDALNEAVATGTVSSGARILQENDYPAPPWRTGPWAGQQEYIASEALQLAEVPRDKIRQVQPPSTPIPGPEVGYDRTPLTIAAAFGGDWSPRHRSWVSGSTQQVRKADLQEDLWSGTLRNASSSVNPMM